MAKPWNTWVFNSMQERDDVADTEVTCHEVLWSWMQVARLANFRSKWWAGGIHRNLSPSRAMGDRPVSNPPGICWAAYSDEAVLQSIKTIVSELQAPAVARSCTGPLAIDTAPVTVADSSNWGEGQPVSRDEKAVEKPRQEWYWSARWYAVSHAGEFGQRGITGWRIWDLFPGWDCMAVRWQSEQCHGTAFWASFWWHLFESYEGACVWIHRSSWHRYGRGELCRRWHWWGKRRRCIFSCRESSAGCCRVRGNSFDKQEGCPISMGKRAYGPDLRRPRTSGAKAAAFACQQQQFCSSWCWSERRVAMLYNDWCASNSYRWCPILQCGKAGHWWILLGGEGRKERVGSTCMVGPPAFGYDLQWPRQDCSTRDWDPRHVQKRYGNAWCFARGQKSERGNETPLCREDFQHLGDQAVQQALAPRWRKSCVGLLQGSEVGESPSNAGNISAGGFEILLLRLQGGWMRRDFV